MDKSTRFWDRIARRYSRQPIADEAAYQKKLEVTRQYFRPETEVLEIGCGTGSTAIAHAPYVKHIRAIDVSSRMIEIARGKAESGNVSNVTFEQSGIDAFSAADGSVDAVLMLSILHLLENRDEVINRVYEMLKLGGIFVSGTACLGDTMSYMKLVLPLGRAVGLFPYVRVFTTEDLESAITSAGFSIDYQWQPSRGKAVFIVALKPG
jgi:ubiquinone/menaquinone biosynthesis C-methylase UbiE